MLRILAIMGAGKKICVWFLANCEVQLCSTLAAISMLSVVCIFPVILDPAIQTLSSSFEEATCQTVYTQYLTGLSNCTWTSCREGCTADIFSCSHIIVLYVKNSSLPSEEEEGIETGNSSLIISSSPLTTFLPTSFSILSQKEAHNLQANSTNATLLTFDRDLIHNLNVSLSSIMSLVRDSLREEVAISELGGESSLDLGPELNISTLIGNLGIGALLPNPQGCVYPATEVHCSDFMLQYSEPGGQLFPCYVSHANRSFVVTTVDRLGAVRNILYCLVPLCLAAGVFTYLFYKTGLICRGRQKRKMAKSNTDEENEDDSTSPRKSIVDKLKAEAPPPTVPGVKKKVRKKFLRQKESSKKKKSKGKIFNKNILNIKSQLSVKGASSPSRAPSISMGVVSSEDMFAPSSSSSNNFHTSVQLM